MQSLRLEAIGEKLVVRELPVPPLRADGVVVRVLAARVLPYYREILDGKRNHSFAVPFTPGGAGIGVIERVGAEVKGLTAGSRVYLDQYMQRGDAWMLMAHTGAEALMRAWPDGAFATHAAWPAENVTSIDEIPEKAAEKLAGIANVVTAYGGLVKAQTRPGDVVAVNGANGNFGAAGVLAALAMGASKVVAIGRDEAGLQELARVDSRVATVLLTGKEDEDLAHIRDLTAGGAHAALDFVGQTKDATSTRALVRALRDGGRAALMGGMTADLPLPYGELLSRRLTVGGNFMYAPTGPKEVIRLAAAGLLRLDALKPRVFLLASGNDALEAAPSLKGLNLSVIAPR